MPPLFPPTGQNIAMGAAATALQLANTSLLIMTRTLVANGLLSHVDAQKMVLEIIEAVRDGTDASRAIPIADQLCHDLEEFAVELGAGNGS